MHASPLVYGRTTTPGDLGSLTLVNRMTGDGERQVTYPTWSTQPDGTLLIRYRDGMSGGGRIVVNRLDPAGWTRLGARALFAPRHGHRDIAAHPTRPVPGPDGRFHMAWVGRAYANADASFQVAYASSADLTAWQGGDGRPVRFGDAQWRGASGPLPLVDVASPVAAVVLGDSGQLAVGAELGVILIRLPVG